MSDKVISVEFGSQIGRSVDDKIFDRNPYIYLDEAACWVAFNSFDRPNSVGPAHISYLIDKSEALTQAFDIADARYYQAYRQVLHALARGLIPAYGTLCGPEEGEEPREKPHDLWDDGRTRFIPVDEFREREPIWLGENALAIGRYFYESVMLEWSQVRKIFGPFVLPYGEAEGEASNRADAVIAIPQPNSSDRTRGRPEKWNWTQILTEIILLANSESGLPKSQAELETWVAEKCVELFDSEPGISTIRMKIAPLYRRLRQSGQ